MVSTNCLMTLRIRSFCDRVHKRNRRTNEQTHGIAITYTVHCVPMSLNNNNNNNSRISIPPSVVTSEAVKIIASGKCASCEKFPENI